jgi:hypothetical protein
MIMAEKRDSSAIFLLTIQIGALHEHKYLSVLTAKISISSKIKTQISRVPIVFFPNTKTNTIYLNIPSQIYLVKMQDNIQSVNSALFSLANLCNPYQQHQLIFLDIDAKLMTTIPLNLIIF